MTVVQRERMPGAQQRALKRAIMLTWLTLGYLVIDTTLLFLVKGNSQAMQVAWIQDLLALVPPLSFLVGTRVLARRASKRFPYGFHQAMDVSHFLSATALLGFGGFLFVQSAMSLLNAQRPDIGLMVIFGFEIWHGWLMVAVLVAGAIPPLILGRMKIEPAKQLHNKVLFTDSKMNKADWTSSLAAVVGVLGVGVGIWWADAVAAIIISLDILWDGIRNLWASLSSLIDSTPDALGESKPHPLPAQVNRYLLGLSWVKEAGCRVREEGQVFHVEAFVVPTHPETIAVDSLIKARDGCRELDWKIYDVVVAPVDELPGLLTTDT